jgi:hypothetical protein
MQRFVLPVLLLVLLLPPVSTLAARLNEVVAFEPTPVAVPSSLSRAAATRAVVRAFVMRSWRVTAVDDQTGYVDAEYPIRVHVARVRARIEDGAVSFHYRDSEKIDHGWKVRTEKLSSKPDAFGRTQQGKLAWKLTDSPDGPESTEVVHPKYLEWVENVSRTLEGTFRLETLAAQ